MCHFLITAFINVIICQALQRTLETIGEDGEPVHIRLPHPWAFHAQAVPRENTHLV